MQTITFTPSSIFSPGVSGIKYIHIVVQLTPSSVPTTLPSSQTEIPETSSPLAGLSVLTVSRPPPGQRFWGSLFTGAAAPPLGFLKLRMCWGPTGMSSPKSGCRVTENRGQAQRSWLPHPHSRGAGALPSPAHL